MRLIAIGCTTLALLALAPSFLPAQEEGEGRDVLAVFLDCQNLFCDFDHLRREIPWVNWARDRQVAEVHVLGTAEGTGAGGRQITLTTIGRGPFVGRVDTLRFATGVTDTDEERRAALTGALALALVPYAAGTPLAERLRIVYVGPAATVATDAEDDPWNYWVFTLEAGGGLGGESRQREYDLRGVTRASRTTEAWKLFLRFEAEYSREEFELDEDSVFVDARTELSLFGLTVWSLGPHWSVGALADAEQSTFDNFDLAIETGTAIEFSVFPYAESTRRAITIQYAAGLGFYNYEEETVFGELQETLALHQLDGAVHVQQPWGNIRMGLGARQFLHDPARYRVDLFGRLSLRIFRGFNFNVFGNVARVKDQINLPAGDLPPEEILIQRRLLGTDFEYDVRLSFSYTFGSIFNNIVNPRF